MKEEEDFAAESGELPDFTWAVEEDGIVTLYDSDGAPVAFVNAEQFRKLTE